MTNITNDEEKTLIRDDNKRLLKLVGIRANEVPAYERIAKLTDENRLLQVQADRICKNCDVGLYLDTGRTVEDDPTQMEFKCNNQGCGHVRIPRSNNA